MAVILKRPNEEQAREVVCGACGCTVGYYDSEVEPVDSCQKGIYCPNCNKVIVTEEYQPFTWPTSFYRYDQNKQAINTKDEQVQRMIDLCVKAIKEGQDYHFQSTGNTFVASFACEDEILVVVAKDYWEECE